MQNVYAPNIFEPSPSHLFVASFLFQGIPSPLDFAFQRISGLSRELNVTSHSEGGENVRNNYLADKIDHGSLVLERGVMTVTPLTGIFEHIMRGGELIYADVVILLLGAYSLPVASWTLSNALPVRWQTGDFDASTSKVLINTLELRYQEMFGLGVKA
ncbi:phage tail protein [Burkholderia ubonensis]|uniref:phage tail protein n=1 Tax=Burkholderia ubonensis TaxID=101571 RepID=UPI00075E8716|nr:phage tail protein [Burkholderia ubonensis]KWI32626.1 phage tail protein [Burkholderia ubonensis]OJB13507.1 phage tail protein [Burkholderia ubonensis]